MEDYFFEIKEDAKEDKVFVLIIYDIVSNKKRVKFAKYLQGYGFRIQKSAFEAVIKENIYRKMLAGIPQFVSSEDSVRVYKIIGKGQVKNFGMAVNREQDEDAIIF
ncbi:MAG: CRISPR-associated endonuclease Cas2 [Lachnospiraceae bacterium]|jgi:CRISPR-associated protein Cas2|nr:CRISPR-associated endonuclease Cas2 [Lachnospiraceae bacterium]